MKICDARQDKWGADVKSRINFIHDLHAADAIYHKSCDVNFRTEKNIPASIFSADEQSTIKKHRGRPDEARFDAFSKIIQFVQDNKDEQLTISMLIEKMSVLLQGSESEPYKRKFMKEKFLEHFGDRIIILSCTDGKSNIVTLRDTAFLIFQDFHALPKSEDLEEEKLRLLKAAAKLIRQDIKSIVKLTNETYPIVP